MTISEVSSKTIYIKYQIQVRISIMSSSYSVVFWLSLYVDFKVILTQADLYFISANMIYSGRFYPICCYMQTNTASFYLDTRNLIYKSKILLILPLSKIFWQSLKKFRLNYIYTGCPKKHGNSVTNSISSLLYELAL